MGSLPKKTIDTEALSAETFKQAAIQGLSDLFEEALNREERDDEYFDYWSDGESVLESGLLPSGDGILSLTELIDILESMGEDGTALLSDVRQLFEKDEHRLIMQRTSSDFFNRYTLSDERKNAVRTFYYSGFPYITKGHLNQKGLNLIGEQNPEMTASVAYAVIASDGVYRNQEYWSKKAKSKDFSGSSYSKVTKDQVKKLTCDALSRLCDTQIPEEGWVWRSFPKSIEGKNAQQLYQDDPLLKSELMATFLATGALSVALSNRRDMLGVNLKERCENALSSSINWVVNCLHENANARNYKGWNEYGKTGRARLIDQVLGLKILFSAGGDYSDRIISQNNYLIGEVMQNILRLMLNQADTVEPDYHLLRGQDLTGLVVWEDYSLPYWMLGLINTVSNWSQEIKQRQKEIKDSKNKFALTDQMLFGAADNLYSIIHSPMAQAVINSSLLRLLNQYRSDSKFLWPRGEYHRVYATGEAIKALLELSQNPLILSDIDTTDKLFITIQKTISSPLFSADFAENAARYIQQNFSFQTGGDKTKESIVDDFEV